ncbi:hypothetical protein PVA44_02380 [Entomospira nematocerorum]|uniref:Uncharacterized protein n=1 Tax=Entomospira nematocerorum TaxID=2719987 RepID=A0A968GC41_9SPIO|nr:hypothetical protein [Entomospira nematocera]NIZ47120.1 hypothetical protein [Entomospira nematocera]WDI34336.1 hypothetical protein PVA44_02380 [Entomospira nematocera]
MKSKNVYLKDLEIIKNDNPIGFVGQYSKHGILLHKCVFSQIMGKDNINKLFDCGIIELSNEIIKNMPYKLKKLQKLYKDEHLLLEPTIKYNVIFETGINNIEYNQISKPDILMKINKKTFIIEVKSYDIYSDKFKHQNDVQKSLTILPFELSNSPFEYLIVTPKQRDSISIPMDDLCTHVLCKNNWYGKFMIHSDFNMKLYEMDMVKNEIIPFIQNNLKLSHSKDSYNELIEYGPYAIYIELLRNFLTKNLIIHQSPYEKRYISIHFIGNDLNNYLYSNIDMLKKTYIKDKKKLLKAIGKDYTDTLPKNIYPKKMKIKIQKRTINDIEKN